MSVTIHEVLGGLRESALDKRDQGDKFERSEMASLADAARRLELVGYSPWGPS